VSGVTLYFSKIDADLLTFLRQTHSLGHILLNTSGVIVGVHQGAAAVLKDFNNDCVGVPFEDLISESLNLAKFAQVDILEPRSPSGSITRRQLRRMSCKLL
jgi:hypothetical protein